MESPEGIVEAVQVESSVAGAEAVARVAAVGDTIIAGEVAEVAEVLDAHVAESEERHEEILEGEAWLKSQLDLLLTTLTANQLQLLLELSGIRTELVSLRQSPGSSPSTPPPPPAEAMPEAIVVVAPESAVEENPVARTEPEPKRRRRLI